MKTKANIPESAPKFPALYQGKNDGVIFLFTSEHFGIVVVNDNGEDHEFPVGKFIDNLNISCECLLFWERLPPGTTVTLIQE